MYHVIAMVTIADDVLQPKINGVKSGYAPHHKFSGVEYLVSGFHTYSDDAVHFPGETLKTRIAFPSWEFISDQVKVGDRFEILEMNRVVGHGTVESIAD